MWQPKSENHSNYPGLRWIFLPEYMTIIGTCKEKLHLMQPPHFFCETFHFQLQKKNWPSWIIQSSSHNFFCCHFKPSQVYWGQRLEFHIYIYISIYLSYIKLIPKGKICSWTVAFPSFHVLQASKHATARWSPWFWTSRSDGQTGLNSCFDCSLNRWDRWYIIGPKKGRILSHLYIANWVIAYCIIYPTYQGNQKLLLTLGMHTKHWW